MDKYHKRLLAVWQLCSDRYLPRYPRRVGSRQFYLSKNDARVIDSIMAEGVSIEVTRRRTGHRLMTLKVQMEGVEPVKLQYFFADKSALDAVKELKRDEYSLMKLSLSGKTVVDFGANVGDFAIVCAKFGAKVVAFEPNSLIYKILQSNIELNREGEHVTAYNFGLWDSKIRSKAAFDFRGSGAGKAISDSENLTFRKSTAFDLLPASEVLASLNSQIDFLKVDIEGAEYRVMLDLCSSGVLEEKVLEGAMEYHDGIGELHIWLEEAGFEWSSVTKDQSYGLIRFWRKNQSA